MEPNVQVMAKRVWHIVRVAAFMLRKNICRKKLLLDLKYFSMKRPILAGKSLTAGKLTLHDDDDGGAYTFSCSDTPSHPNYFPFKKAKRGPHKRPTHAPISEEEASDMHAVERVLESMMTGLGRKDDVEGSPYPYLYSPILPGFGFGSPSVEQLRVTDSPYPFVNDDEEEETGRVDEAAEEFIQRFYAQLRQQ